MIDAYKDHFMSAVTAASAGRSSVTCAPAGVDFVVVDPNPARR